MANSNAQQSRQIERPYTQKAAPLLVSTPWILRVTDHKDKPGPVFIIKERVSLSNGNGGSLPEAKRYRLKERGCLYGEQQRRCLPIIRAILGRITSLNGVPLELHSYLRGSRILFRGNLPLDEEAGAKLALIFKLQAWVRDMDRVELIARRVDRFTGEEAAYWLSRISNFGPVANRWCLAGMRIMLGGQSGDANIEKMLERFR